MLPIPLKEEEQQCISHKGLEHEGFLSWHFCLYYFLVIFSAHTMQSSYGFVDYFDRRSAALAIVTLNGRHL